MSADIGPGDWVECIKSNGDPAVSEGALYCVEQVVDADPGGECWQCGSAIGIDLFGVSADSEHAWCGGCQFRPVYRPPEAFLHHILQPAPEREYEDA